MIYLDHHATTPVAPEVVAAMLPCFGERFGNPSSRHHASGQEAHRAVEEARAQVAGLVGAAPEEIVFTSGATESAEAGGKGSHVLRALGLNDARVYTSLRFGIGRYNTPAEIDAVVDALAEAVHAARSRTSPVRE